MRRLIAAMVVVGGMATVGMAQETATGMTEAQVQEKIEAAMAAKPKTWVDSITFKGDLRYRFEQINDDSKFDASKENYTRQRERIRARLAAEAKVNDQAKVTVGLSTGQADPISGNQTLGDGFGKKEMRLDLANVDYNFTGDSVNELHVIAGKMKNPFITMSDDLTWDGDCSPEGIALKSQVGEGVTKFIANGGYMWVQERSDKTDTMLYAGQAAFKFDFSPEVALTLGSSYYGYQDVQGSDVIDWEGKNNAYGNSTVAGTISGSTTNKAWANEYTPVVYFAQLDLFVGEKALPFSIFGQELSNTDVDDFDQGHLYGVSIGKAKNPKTAEVGYSYAELEKDAVLGMSTDSDRWGGGTDGKGSKIYAKYQFAKGLQGAVTYFIDKKTISNSAKETDYDRLQVDLIASF
jgi:hypothetical protein